MGSYSDKGVVFLTTSIFFLFLDVTIKDPCLLWRKDLEQSREPGVWGRKPG